MAPTLPRTLTRQRPDVVLVKPPMQVARGNHLTLACPPLGIAYLAAALRARGTTVRVVDAVGEDPFHVEPLGQGLLRYGLSERAVLDRIAPGATLIGVSCMFSEEWPLVRDTIRAIGRRFPDALLVAGGEHVSAAPGLVLEQCPEVDACVLGEGEDTLVEIVERMEQGLDLDGVAGVALRDTRGLRCAPRRARIRDIDRLPVPAWDLLPMEAYLSNGLGYGVNRGRSIPIIATRGCPFQCTFCSSPQMWTTRWAARDPELVLAEMEHAIETYGARNFDFYDLTAIVRTDWIVEFTRRLIEKNWGITWQIPAGTRSEALSEDVVGLLFRSGCRNVAYAPESGSPAMLVRVKKRVKLDRMLASMRHAVAAGLMVKCNLIMGFPDETREEMLETIRFCRTLARIGVHDVNVTPFCPYPGSELFDRLVESGKLPGLTDEYFRMLASYSDLTHAASFSEDVSSAGLGYLRWSAMAQFYASSFVRHPERALSLVRSLVTNQQRTRLERAVSDIVRRQVHVWRAKAA